jgi:hypothetical protein
MTVQVRAAASSVPAIAATAARARMRLFPRRIMRD